MALAQSPPSTVFGLTAYNGEAHLAEAIESLLTQTRGDLAIVVVDDCSSDRTEEIARRYADLDLRLTYERNERQLGLVRNWRRAFDLAARVAPEALYFAWASDHDVWHPRWLEALAAELDANPEAVLAYPLGVRMDESGAEYPSREWRFDTGGVSGRAERVRRTSREMTTAGAMIYGLMRRTALERCGAFPLVVLPDRLHLARLAVEGEFRQVRRPLWYRRYRVGETMSNSRQRRATFPAGAPFWARLPWWLGHAVLFFRSLELDAEQARLARVFLRESVGHAFGRRRERVRRERRWRRRERRRRYRSMVRSVLSRRGRTPAGTGPELPAEEVEAEAEAPSPLEAATALERTAVLDDLAPGAVLVEIGGEGSRLRNELQPRFAELVHMSAGDPEGLPERVDLAVNLGSLGRLQDEQIERWARQLHEAGAPVLYSLDRESAGLTEHLGRWYWLRDVWIPSRRDDRQARKPDPTSGPVPRPVGRYRHVVGRRRLIPSRESPKLG